jgi:hypothetical protein
MIRSISHKACKNFASPMVLMGGLSRTNQSQIKVLKRQKAEAQRKPRISQDIPLSLINIRTIAMATAGISR